jgi:hypothetical protein
VVRSPWSVANDVSRNLLLTTDYGLRRAMPIRFRCAYCSQLMGIARRKAGTVVSCPTCHGQVVVPDPGPGVEETERAATDGPPPLFERSDFDEVFAPVPGGPVPAPAKGSTGANPIPVPIVPSAPPPPPDAPGKGWAAAQQELSFDVERAPEPVPETVRTGQTGVWLSPTAMTLLCLMVVVLLALSFVAGLLLGRSLGG